MSEAIFRGVSGRLHRFSVHRPDERFGAAPAVYCFARPTGRGWAPLFLSRTGNLQKRLTSHEQWPEAQLLGATHILSTAPTHATRANMSKPIWRNR